MSPVDTRAARRPTHVGADALTRLAVRLSWLYTLTAVVALLWLAVEQGPGTGVLQAVAVSAGFVLNGLVVAQVCRHRSRGGIVAVTLTDAIAPAAAAVLAHSQGWDGGQLIAATAATAGAMGTALAIGPVLGLHTAFVALVFISVGSWIGGDTPSVVWLAGCAVGSTVGAVIGVLARRAFRIADAAIVGADEAVIATEVTAARWAARRAVDREMHDTVLTTFSLLAHADPEADQVALRELCRRDVAVLTHGTPAKPERLPSVPRPVSRTAVTPVNGVPLPPTALEELADAWAEAGLKVSTHGTSWDTGVAGLPPHTAASLLGAIRECLSNVARHAGTETADVTVSRGETQLTTMVVDTGSGFDPAAVPTDRLGLSESVRGRVVDLGGAVSVFSRPGEGTTVVLTLPLTLAPANGVR